MLSNKNYLDIETKKNNRKIKPFDVKMVTDDNKTAEMFFIL